MNRLIASKLYKSCLQNRLTDSFIRALQTSVGCLIRGPGRRANRGIGLQLSALEAQEELQQDPEGFGDIESDFMHVHRSHRQHERNLEFERERVRLHMVRHKYFRDVKLPNLLTYSEKEQMRLLHTRDPQEWTVERLAESFPATTNIVSKVLQAKWRARSEKRIRAHDEAVIHNWEKLRNDDDSMSQLPADLKEHLQRFAERKQVDLAQTEQPLNNRTARLALPQPKKQEFLSIITSCKKYAHSPIKEIAAIEKPTTTPDAPYADPQAETFLLDKVHDRRKMRMQELKRYKLLDVIDIKDEMAQATPKPAEQPANVFSNPSGTGILSTAKFQSSEVVISAEDCKRYEMTSIKERIRIPRKVYRQGATYRVEDSYYDDDGEFLYRVPGMTFKAASKKHD